MDSIGEAVSQNGLRMTKISGCISTKFAVKFLKSEMTHSPPLPPSEFLWKFINFREDRRP